MTFVQRQIRSLDWSIIAGTWLLFGVFVLVEPIYYATSTLPRDVYTGRSIFASALTTSPAFIFGYALTLFLLIRQPRLWWHTLPKSERLLQLPTAAILIGLAWPLVTLEYNFYLERAFYADRVVLLVIALLVMVHPAFLSAFIVSGHAFTGQLDVPPLYNNWISTQMVYLLSVVLVVYFVLVKGLGLKIKVASVWALLVGVMGASYLLPAVGKIRRNWLWENDLANIVAAAYEQDGWLAPLLPPSAHAQLVRFVHTMRIPMQAGTLLAEGGVILHFFSRRVSMFLFAFCTTLHLIIFATAGILFWQWMLINLSLLAVFWLFGRTHFNQLFPRPTIFFVCASVMLVQAALHPRVARLAWYDTTFVYRFRIEGVGESGTRYEIMPEDFSPWSTRFAQSRLYILTDIPRLTDVLGSVYDYEVHAAIRSATSAEEVNALITQYGELYKDDQQIAEFDTFMRQFMEMTEWRESAEPVVNFHALTAPHHIYTHQRHDALLPDYTFQEPIERIEIDLTHYTFLDDEFEVVSHHETIYAVSDE